MKHPIFVTVSYFNDVRCAIEWQMSAFSFIHLYNRKWNKKVKRRNKRLPVLKQNKCKLLTNSLNS